MRGRTVGRALVPGIVLATLGIVASTHGGEDQPAGPRFWTWRPPPTEIGLPHVVDRTFIPMMRRIAGASCSDPSNHCCEDDCDCSQRTPESVLAGIVNEVQANPDLYGGEFCIVLQEAGHGDGDPCPETANLSHTTQAMAIFQHWCDSYDETNNFDCAECPQPEPGSGHWITPWMTHGICESRTWMDEFVELYLAEQQAGVLPAPKRFAFDSEVYPVTWWEGGDMAVQNFLKMAGLAVYGQGPDPRWSTEIIPGTGQTLESLYEDALAAGVSQPFPIGWDHPFNHDWTRWYDGVVLTACDAAMRGAFYDPIEEAWPDAGTSNLLTSVRFDGGTVAPGSPPRSLRQRVHAAADWYTVKTAGSASMQAPEVYPVSDQNLQPGETPGQATVRLQRANIEAILASFGGFPAESISPWIAHVGTPFRIYFADNSQEYVVTKSDMRALLAMLRGEGINEFLSWTALTETNDPDWLGNWRQADDLVDQVWGPSVAGYVIAEGGAASATAAQVERLAVSDWAFDPADEEGVVSITGAAVGRGRDIAYTGALTVDFTSPFTCDAIGQLDLVIDGRIEGDVFAANPAVAVSIEALNGDTNHWEPIDVTDPRTDAYENTIDPETGRWVHSVPTGGFQLTPRRTVLTVTDTSAWHHVDATGEIAVRLRFTSDEPFTAKIDMVQLVGADDGLPGEICRADCFPAGGDGIVDIDDLVSVIGAWGAGSGPCDIDPVCGDGIVGIDDVIEIIVSWGACQ